MKNLRKSMPSKKIWIMVSLAAALAAVDLPPENWSSRNVSKLGQGKGERWQGAGTVRSR